MWEARNEMGKIKKKLRQKERGEQCAKRDP